jgi:hypothetical protein
MVYYSIGGRWRLAGDRLACRRSASAASGPAGAEPGAGPRAQMDPSGKSKGPPPAVKKVLSLFGSGREEDRMVGYLSFLKIGPKLLRFLPGAPPPSFRMARSRRGHDACRLPCACPDVRRGSSAWERRHRLPQFPDSVHCAPAQARRRATCATG